MRILESHVLTWAGLLVSDDVQTSRHVRLENSDRSFARLGKVLALLGVWR